MVNRHCDVSLLLFHEAEMKLAILKGFNLHLYLQPSGLLRGKSFPILKSADPAPPSLCHMGNDDMSNDY